MIADPASLRAAARASLRRVFRVGTIVFAASSAVFGAGASASAQPASVAASLGPADAKSLQREARLIVDLLQNHHYSGRPFSDIDSHSVLDAYLESLDPDRRFFTQGDVDFVQRRFGRTLKPVYIFRGDLQPGFEIFDLFSQRARARLDWIERRLAQPFDFTGEADADSGEKPKPPADEAEADRRWERDLSGQVLEEILAGRTPAGAAAEVQRRGSAWWRSFEATDATFVRERFLDVLLRAFDPHSGYFSAASAREFDAEMQGADVGPGLALDQRDGRWFVSAVEPGGPADLDGRIRTGDEIEALADGDGPELPLAGRHLPEVAAALRGEGAMPLRLTVRPPGLERIEIALQRARLVQIGDRARGAVSTVPADDGPARRIGWIELPAFYGTPQEPEVASATRDVRELIERLQTGGIDALVVDLRRNPGGLLPEAVSLAGLFLAPGRVLLTRGLDGKVEEHVVAPGPVAYSGPLVVLTSQASASASEVFAGALEHHRRAVIVGGRTTFGKGTVQTFVDFARAAAGASDARSGWGLLRLTTQRFYRPDGGALQRNGVPSDVVLPELDDPDFEGEAALPLALPAEAIEPPAGPAPTPEGFAPVTDGLLEKLRTRSVARAAALPEFSLWRRESELLRALAADTPRSLRLEVRQREQEHDEAARAALRQERRALSASAAFATTAVETAAVAAVLASHETALRDAPAARPRRGHLAGRTFFAVRPDGGTADLAIDGIDFRRFFADAPVLAGVFATAAGGTVEAAAIEAALRELTLLVEEDEAAVIAVFARHAPAGLDRAAVVAGLEALLQRLVEIDGAPLRERPALDVPLREALRIAADCAAEAPPAPVAGGPAP